MTDVSVGATGAKLAVVAVSDALSPSKCSECGATKADVAGGLCSGAFWSSFTALPFTGHSRISLVADGYTRAVPDTSPAGSIRQILTLPDPPS